MEEYSWVPAILALPRIFFRTIYPDMIYERQCFVLYTLADSMAHYARHWWSSVLYDIRLSRSAALVGLELLKALKRGLSIVQICARKRFPAVIWTILGGVGQFQEIVEDVKRYAQMMNRLLERSKSCSFHSQKFKQQETVEHLTHQIESSSRALQTSLSWAYEEDKVKVAQLLKSMKSKKSDKILSGILRCFWSSNLMLDDGLVAGLISILERGSLPNIAERNLCLGEHLGGGSFGWVLKAQWCKLPLAVKNFRYEDHFLDELKVFEKFLATDYSSHVVGIIGTCEDERVVLELMDKDLICLIQDKCSADLFPFPLDDSVDIMLQISKGMRYLHNMDVIYRDLKPSNVLIQMKGDKSYVIKLADFGVSKENFKTEHSNTSNQGTKLYMAPEMMEERGTYTRKVDVYSFGIVCSEILTGTAPSLDRDFASSEERPLLPPNIPIRLDRLIRRCWDMEEHKRPSFTDICDELWLVKEELLTRLVTEDADWLRGLATGSRKYDAIRLLSWLRPRCRNKEILETNVMRITNFKYGALKRATGGFSQKIGERKYGAQFYRGVLEDGSEVAVKVLQNFSSDSASQFDAELLVMGRVRHKNVVALRGWCLKQNKRIYVYDYMENGSLHEHLFSADRILSWSHRFEIVKQVVEGLVFLHFGWEERILHRDIKPSHVLLDAGMVPHLGGFEDAMFMDKTELDRSTSIVGTVGYIDPAYIAVGKVSDKSDVFSFGMLLLTVACGINPLDLVLGRNLLFNVWKAQQSGNLLKVADPRLASDYMEEEMRVVLSLGLLCTNKDPELRPSTRTCCEILNGKVPLPNLPSGFEDPTPLTPEEI